MSEFQPIQFEISNVSHQFEYGLTTVYQNRIVAHQPLNRIEAVEFGTQRVFIFDAVNAMIFLAGQELPGHSLRKKQLDRLTKEMDYRVGWNADLLIQDRPDNLEDLTERYVRLATVAMKGQIYVPENWG